MFDTYTQIYTWLHFGYLVKFCDFKLWIYVEDFNFGVETRTLLEVMVNSLKILTQRSGNSLEDKK